MLFLLRRELTLSRCSQVVLNPPRRLSFASLAAAPQWSLAGMKTAPRICDGKAAHPRLLWLPPTCRCKPLQLSFTEILQFHTLSLIKKPLRNFSLNAVVGTDLGLPVVAGEPFIGFMKRCIPNRIRVTIGIDPV